MAINLRKRLDTIRRKLNEDKARDKTTEELLKNIQDDINGIWWLMFGISILLILIV